MKSAPGSRRFSGGFTLIELLIVVVLVAVLAAIALPSFLDQIRKSRRADAINVMAQVAQAQERWRANNSAYIADFGTAGLNVGATAASGVTSLTQTYYTISVNAAASAAYRVRAVATGSQASDTKCAEMEMRMAGGNLAYVSVPQGGNISTATTDANRCWNR